MQSINTIPFVPNTKAAKIKSFCEADPYFPERNLKISGITKDSTGATISNCIITLIDITTGIIYPNSAISDSLGNFILDIPVGFSQIQTDKWQLIAKSSDGTLVGITLDNLTGV